MKQVLVIGFLLIFLRTSAQDIAFHVKDHHGQYMKEAEIVVWLRDSSWLKTTDANGYMTIQGLKAQQTIMLYVSECVFHYTVPANVPETPVEVQLQCPAQLDQPAEFPGGASALRRYMAENLRYPQSAVEKEIQGKVYVRFIVGTEGQISQVTVERSLADCPECDAEAIRLVESMPFWIPGKAAGTPVKSVFNLPVTFKLY